MSWKKDTAVDAWVKIIDCFPCWLENLVHLMKLMHPVMAPIFGPKGQL